MVTLAKDVKKGLGKQVKEDFPEVSFNLASEQIDSLNARIELEASRAHLSDTYLITTTYCNGEVQSVEAEKLYSSFETRYEEKIIQELVQAKRVLESMDIKARISVYNENEIEELRIATTPNSNSIDSAFAVPEEIKVKEGESVFQKITEIIYGKQSQAFVVQSLEQLNEIIKFAEKFGIKSLLPAPRMQDLEVQEIAISRIPALELLQIEADIPQDAELPNIPLFRSEAMVQAIEGLGNISVTPITASTEPVHDLGSRDMTFGERFATAKIKASIRRDLEAAKLKNEEPRKSLLELSNYVLAA